METVLDKNAYFERYKSVARPDGSSDSWLTAIRDRAMTRFSEIGFPTTKDEEWRFTNIKAISGTAFAHPGGEHDLNPTVLKADLLEGEGARLVFVDGVYRPELSQTEALPEGAQILNLQSEEAGRSKLIKTHFNARCDEIEHALPALNTALFDQALVLVLAKETVVTAPIEFHMIDSGSQGAVAVFPRILIIAEPHASAKIVESHFSHGDNTSWTNLVTEVHTAPGARIRHYLVDYSGDNALHTNHLIVSQDRDSYFECGQALVGSQLVRRDINIALQGEGAQAVVSGLFVGTSARHQDTHILISHEKPHCTSSQNFKGIFDDKSRGVFGGKVYVAQDAQKTDASQSSRALLLSDDARLDTKPQLEIYADDVKCSHGATTGQLDEDALFYLESRGVDPQTAREILIYAFAHEVLDRISIPEVRTQVERVLASRFPKVAQLGA